MKDEAIMVEFDGGKSELSITKMLAELQREHDAAPKGSIDARFAAVLIDMMPGFIRALDRERADHVRKGLYDLEGNLVGPKEIIMEHLKVMALPIANMVASVAMTLWPCQGDGDPCETCVKLRRRTVVEMLENVGDVCLEQVARATGFVCPEDTPLTTQALDAQQKKMH